jgi:hypothetical protein
VTPAEKNLVKMPHCILAIINRTLMLMRMSRESRDNFTGFNHHVKLRSEPKNNVPKKGASYGQSQKDRKESRREEGPRQEGRREEGPRQEEVILPSGKPTSAAVPRDGGFFMPGGPR